MLPEYIAAAMATAEFELDDDPPGFIGTLSGCQGVWAVAPDKESCLEELRSVLEDWIMIRLAHGLDIPVVDGRTVLVAAVA